MPILRCVRALPAGLAQYASAEPAALRLDTAAAGYTEAAAAMTAKLTELDAEHAKALAGGGAKYVDRHHARGKLTARERIEVLLDEGTFSEMDEFARHRSTAFGLESRRPYGDGVIIGVGAIHGRPVCVFSQDVGIFGGSLGEVYGTKIAKIIDFATTTGCKSFFYFHFDDFHFRSFIRFNTIFLHNLCTIKF